MPGRVAARSASTTSPTGRPSSSAKLLHERVRHPPRPEEIGHPHEHDQRAARQRAVDARADGGGRGGNDPGDQEVGALDQDADDQEDDHYAGKDPPLGEEEIEEDESPEEQDGIGHQLAHDEGAEERVIGAASRRGHRMPGHGIEGAKPANDLRDEADRSEAEAEGDQVEPSADAARRGVTSQLRHAHLLAFPTQTAASLAGRRAIDKAAARRPCRPCAPWISPSRSSRTSAGRSPASGARRTSRAPSSSPPSSPRAATPTLTWTHPCTSSPAIATSPGCPWISGWGLPPWWT